MKLNLEDKERVVIFSHGLGMRKDDGGLFTDIAEELAARNISSVLFDYNRINEDSKEVFVPPFSEQVPVLQQVINNARTEKPAAEIVIVAHSQGCIIPALADISGVSQVIALAPFFHTDISEVLKRYKKDPKNTIDFSGVSKRHRSDGTTTLLPAEYWSERFKTDVVGLYNALALKTKLTLVYGQEDQIMDFNDLRKIKNTHIINIDGDHDFSGQYREGLIKLILNELV